MRLLVCNDGYVTVFKSKHFDVCLLVLNKFAILNNCLDCLDKSIDKKKKLVPTTAGLSTSKNQLAISASKRFRFSCRSVRIWNLNIWFRYHAYASKRTFIRCNITGQSIGGARLDCNSMRRDIEYIKWSNCMDDIQIINFKFTYFIFFYKKWQNKI